MITRWSPALAAAALLAGCAGPPASSPSPMQAPSRIERPIPYPATPPAEYQRAVAAGTRTTTGAPGARYWQNRADYAIRTRVIPDQKRLEGSETITYTNHSPNPLAQLHVDLTLNQNAGGVVRNEPAEVTGGVEVTRVAVDGQTVAEGGRNGARYSINGTRMIIVPASPVAPGATVRIAVDWGFKVPQAGASGRMGYSEDNLFFFAYFYPAMAVYDDVIGWQPDPFRGTAEFYADFGSYDVTVEAPPQWIVHGTGVLQNPEQTLAPAILQRYRQGIASDQVVHVVTPADFGHTTTAGQNGLVSWRFRADSVRDVAYSVTRASNWDARRTAVGDRDGDGRADHTAIHAFWRANAPRWARAADMEAHAITFLSEFTGLPYPWPHMTSVEAEDIISGGMEYPMMTIISAYTRSSDESLYGVTAHELAHMWVPMIVSVDERRYSWMDEGMTTYHEAQARKDTFPTSTGEIEDRESYLNTARAGGEGEIMRRSDFHYTSGAFGTASYPKPSTNFVSLRAILGEATFNRAWRTFQQRWAWKHPYPWDLFNTFEEVSGRDLDWFWRTWFYETWTLDQAVGSVTEGSGGATIVIEDRGLAPMPARVTVTRENGDTQTVEVPVETWLEGRKSATLTLPRAASPVIRVEIDAENAFPDIDRGNNVWTRPGS
ncbi:MAG TPA: M1 family metallopeptidase [Longimicrobium sp.]|nr:M1 family metallopeptidase [Longimicrobium sp.]